MNDICNKKGNQYSERLEDLLTGTASKAVIKKEAPLLLDHMVHVFDSKDYDETTAWLERLMAHPEELLPLHLKRLLAVKKQKPISRRYDQLPDMVVHEISRFVNERTRKKFVSINRSFYYHQEKLEQIRKTSSELFDETMKAIDPGVFAMDLRVCWTSDDIEKEYQQFSDALSFTALAPYFERITLPPVTRDKLKGLLMGPLQEVALCLNEYVQAYGLLLQHESVKESAAELSDSLLKQFTDVKKADFMLYANETTIAAFEQSWGKLLREIDRTLEQMKQDFTTLLFSLIAETMFQVIAELNAEGLRIEQFPISEGAVQIDLTQAEKDAVTSLIADVLEESPVNLARLERVIDFIQETPLVARLSFSDSQSILYALMVRWFSEKASNLAALASNNPGQFLAELRALYARLNMVIDDRDVKQLGGVTQFELLQTFVHVAVGSEWKLYFEAVFDYTARMIDRYEGKELFEGEDVPLDDPFFSLVVLMALYAKDQGMRHKFISYCEHHDFSEDRIESLINEYKDSQGKDRFASHFLQFGGFGKGMLKSIMKKIGV